LVPSPIQSFPRYDGQTFVKPPEVLTRDRLLGMYETKPVLQKLRVTLVGSGAMLVTSAVLLLGIIRAEADEDGMYGRASFRSRNQVQEVSRNADVDCVERVEGRRL
jgi:hypothetical protein